jgi:hypothetical protein
MRFSWGKDAKTVEPRKVVNAKALELETAKEILTEVFHARPSEIEDMIQIRLDERSLQEEHEEGP